MNISRIGLLVLSTLILPQLSPAIAKAAETASRTVNFLCTAADQPTLNRFTGSGTVDIKDEISEGAFSGAMTLSGKTPEPREIGELSVKGSAQIIPPGKFAKDEVIVLKMSSQRSGKDVHLMFNLGLNGDWSSTFIADGVSYRAKCAEYRR